MRPPIHIKPEPWQWPHLLNQKAEGRVAGQSIDKWRRRTRRELALPEDRVIIGTGHQPGLWHPGILAKYIAADVVGRWIGGARGGMTFLVVDQDVDPAAGTIDVPVRGKDGALEARSIVLIEIPNEVPVGFAAARPPARAVALSDAAIASIRQGVSRAISALERHRGSSSAAGQLAGAAGDLMSRWVGEARTVCASELMRTSFGRALIDFMRSDPARCASAYNRAARDHPEAHISPLDVRGDVIELPLWRIDEAGRRRRAFSTDLEDDDVSAQRLQPRALLMTAFIRLVIFDLFIHGTGGWTYEVVMEQWIREWLGIRVGPMTMVSADLHLPFEVEAAEEAVEEVMHAFRRAYHDPPTLEATVDPPSSEKQAFLAEIESRPRNSPGRRDAFHTMHAWLEGSRDQHCSELNAMRNRLEQAERRARTRDILTRRDWSFVLYPIESIDELAEGIRSAFDSDFRLAASLTADYHRITR